ncbi:E3 ubiquitin-protein ligase TRIM39-like [Genypterus blacodes]|uniref:E3 ubiquitin-protein ligase TRIM39-like n=1 Tax=Genypterus blacodes TaxID=154954 RepID=UPI003F771DD9
MSAASCLLSEEQFLCSICLEVFTDPVSTPCGHNFCKICITKHWKSKAQCVCPLCNQGFYRRPELKVNTFISQMASEFRQSTKIEDSFRSEEPAAKPGEVQCDFCTGTKLKAIKSCLKCEASYCQTHLEPHLTAARLKSHQLIHPVDNLEDRMCKKHNDTLKLFCRTDQTCVCSLCPALDHKNHEFVPLEEEYEAKKAELEKTEAELKQKIQFTQVKIQEIQQSEQLSREAADRERAEGVQIFTALKQHVEDIQADFMETLEEKQRSTKKQAEDFIKELQQELSELTKVSAEVEKLLLSEDHLLLLQSFLSISPAPPTKDWTQVRVQRSYEGSVVKAVAQLEETISQETKKLLEVELKRIQQFSVDVTLDPDSAHPKLILSDDEREVYRSDVRKNLPDNPERFDTYVSVLGKQSFSSGRFYYEVQVKGKTGWDLGVTTETSSRKGTIIPSPQNGFWTVGLWKDLNELLTHEDRPVRLSVKSRPEKVAVFVDYEEGLVSFYDVDAPALIFSFTGCSFSHKLLPFFCPCFTYGGTSSAPLIISAVSHPTVFL